ncbi:MAG: class I SAM-dependent methyltransferase [Rhodospirillales bacterium]|nr:class I SAM-dependent methyltransferase [Rhodospirillales bacterium]
MEKTITKTRDNFETSSRPDRLSVRERLLARWLKRIVFGRLTVDLPSGRRVVFQGDHEGPLASIQVHDLNLIYRIAIAGDMGLAEGYMQGEWETPDLTTLLHLGAANATAFDISIEPNWFVNILNRLRHACRANTKHGSRRNIAAHYDLGNDFYGKWLDETMSYSAALFEDFSEGHAAAQRQKYVRLAESIDLKAGDRVLEIGCGWGGFAEIAAADYGCSVLCLTLSKEQARYATQRMAGKGLSEQVEIRVQDYRDVDGQYDKIVSIEMFEAVGEAYWKTYLDILGHRLTPGGRAALQIITISDACFSNYRKSPDFIQRYIFPGGMLPSPAAFEAAVVRSNLRISESFYFGKSYAETLRRWDRMFQENWDEIAAQGFDRTFFRMWRYYLCYCEVGFDRDTIDVGHFVIEHS